MRRNDAQPPPPRLGLGRGLGQGEVLCLVAPSVEFLAWVGPADQQSAVLQPARWFALSFIARPAFSNAAAPGLTPAAALAGSPPSDVAQFW
jgi:hypothetical protein